MCYDVQEINSYLCMEKEKFYKELGERLREIRKSQNISLNELSLKTLISDTYIYQVERGEYGISLLKFIALCNSLCINPNLILKDFIISNSLDDEFLIKSLQGSKNISVNILNFMKYKE